jgi:hypothetical protein
MLSTTPLGGALDSTRCSLRIRVGIRLDADEPWHAPDQLGENQGGAVTILDIGRVHDHAVEPSQVIEDTMTLASHNLLTSVATACPHFSGLARLAVGDYGARMRITPGPLADLGAHLIMVSIQRATVAPLANGGPDPLSHTF